jgi:hypothetical protein
MDWKGGFLQLPWDKETSGRRGFEKLGGEEFLGLLLM